MKWIHPIFGTWGTTIEKLTESDWLSGPIWLKDHPDDWPLSLQPINLVPDDHAAVAVIANTSMTHEPIVDWSRFSSFSKGVRVIAFCLRLKFKRQSKFLLPCELKRAEEKVVKVTQRGTFPEVYDGKQLFCKTSKGGHLAKVSPFFYECKYDSNKRSHQTCKFELPTATFNAFIHKTWYGLCNVTWLTFGKQPWRNRVC